jgi:hypothetical protein
MCRQPAIPSFGTAAVRRYVRAPAENLGCLYNLSEEKKLAQPVEGSHCTLAGCFTTEDPTILWDTTRNEKWAHVLTSDILRTTV